jgi:hypothetical protein
MWYHRYLQMLADYYMLMKLDLWRNKVSDRSIVKHMLHGCIDRIRIFWPVFEDAPSASLWLNGFQEVMTRK